MRLATAPRTLPLLTLSMVLVMACGDDLAASASATASESASGASASATDPASASASASASDSDATGGSASASATGTSTTDDSGTATESGGATTTTTATTDELKLDVGFEEMTGGEDEGCKKVDIVFVVDDSGSMSDLQDKLTAAFPSFMATIDEELVQQKGVDYRVGVISTDMAGTDMCIFNLICGQGHRGRLQHQPDRLNCNDVPDGRWIDMGPLEEVAEEFRCIASMHGGEFSEMPLEALRAGLVDRVSDMEAYNAGFLRDDALLVVVIITDEDDQSVMNVPSTWDLFLGPGKATPVAEYQQLFIDLKGGEDDRLVFVILSGPENDSCGPGNEPTAVKAPRLHQLIDLHAPNSYWGNICDANFTEPLAEALMVIEATCAVFPPPV